MDITLLFILFLIRDFKKPELEKFDCHVQHYAEIFPKKTKSVFIILKEKATTSKPQQQTRNQTLAALQCSGAQGLVQVDVVISENMYRGKSKMTYLLQNLKLITTDQKEEDCATKCCLVSGEPDRNFQNQTEVSFTGKVLLPGVSACSISGNQTEFFAGREHTTNKTKNDTLKERKKKSILIKILIVCALVPVVLAIAVFVICEIPCPCSCPPWLQQSNNIQMGIAATKKKKEAESLEASGTSATAQI